MSSSVGVVTCAIPERLGMLAENIASVRAQTLQPAGHFIGIDYARDGCVKNLNRLVSAALTAGCQWIAQLADDDLMDSNHLETLVASAQDADIVYTWCRIEGRDWNPNRLFDANLLRQGNYIPATSIVSAELVRRLGGWQPGQHGFEDWDFWLRALDAGARFVCVPTITWTYRFHGGNVSWPM